MNKATKPEIIEDKLSRLEEGEYLDKRHLIISMYSNYNYFVARSFDVHFAKAKKMLTDKKFQSKNGRISRIA